MDDPIAAYLEYEVRMQRKDLFHKITLHYEIKTALYPGSYIHISPSFYIPKVVYVDSDKKAKKFFAGTGINNFLDIKKEYEEICEFRFYGQNYTKKIPEQYEYFDLLISQYSGFVSQSCKKYLKPKGYLLVNNSHGDAGVANLDPDFNLIAVVNHRSGKFTISDKNLDKYFVPKKSIQDYSMMYLLSLNRGIGYQKAAAHYIFQKI